MDVRLDYVSFDEAARGNKLDTIALASCVSEYGRVVLVGDSKQCLPYVDSGNILIVPRGGEPQQETERG